MHQGGQAHSANRLGGPHGGQIHYRVRFGGGWGKRESKTKMYQEKGVECKMTQKIGIMHPLFTLITVRSSFPSDIH